MSVPIYVAGPLGFSEAGRYFYEREFLPMLRKLGFEVLDPWTLTDAKLIEAAMSAPEGIEQIRKWAELNPIIGANNTEAIRKCRLVIAILDGPDVDSGTASEVGFAAGLGKPVFGYRGDFRRVGDNIASIINIQVEYFIRLNGGEIATSLYDTEEMLRRWLLENIPADAT